MPKNDSTPEDPKSARQKGEKNDGSASIKIKDSCSQRRPQAKAAHGAHGTDATDERLQFRTSWNSHRTVRKGQRSERKIHNSGAEDRPKCLRRDVQTH